MLMLFMLILMLMLLMLLLMLLMLMLKMLMLMSFFVNAHYVCSSVADYPLSRLFCSWFAL